MSKIDDKSGYDHVLLTNELTKYFGIQWGGLWWVCNIFPFRHQSQVSLFLSEKISFWNSRLYDRETTLDILCSRRGGDDSTIPGYGNPTTSSVMKD